MLERKKEKIQKLKTEEETKIWVLCKQNARNEWMKWTDIEQYMKKLNMYG